MNTAPQPAARNSSHFGSFAFRIGPESSDSMWRSVGYAAVTDADGWEAVWPSPGVPLPGGEGGRTATSA